MPAVTPSTSTNPSTVFPSSNSSARGIVTQGIWQKVSKYAINLLYSTIAVVFAYVGTTLFGFGFVGGFVYKDEAMKLSKRVDHLYNSMNFKHGLLIGCFSIIFIHVAFVVQAFYAGVATGEYFANQID